jgi:hypothetical protein
MINRFQGDPKIYLTENGASIKCIGGQPIMDQGIENQAMLSLFGGYGWWANSLIDDQNRHLDSDFEQVASGSITLQKLNDIKQSAERNLKNPVFGKIEAIVSNPVSTNITIDINIAPPGSDIKVLRLSRNNQNWKNQADDPAYMR